ncbi:unnamed protein product [Fraxinus pennsylvanica]|uniref:Uncharacterized protein n=1 Tax=Fraxinus pennsylvanica TaxID=56036 RepID=A0AAD2ADN8_9LAMI|nr:unnamed protein product [Fraxinus pennsylvanica]
MSSYCRGHLLSLVPMQESHFSLEKIFPYAIKYFSICDLTSSWCLDSQSSIVSTACNGAASVRGFTVSAHNDDKQRWRFWWIWIERSGATGLEGLMMLVTSSPSTSLLQAIVNRATSTRYCFNTTLVILLLVQICGLVMRILDLANHPSIVTEPINSVIHPVADHFAYFAHFVIRLQL